MAGEKPYEVRHGSGVEHRPDSVVHTAREAAKRRRRLNDQAGGGGAPVRVQGGGEDGDDPRYSAKMEVEDLLRFVAYDLVLHLPENL